MKTWRYLRRRAARETHIAWFHRPPGARDTRSFFTAPPYASGTRLSPPPARRERHTLFLSPPARRMASLFHWAGGGRKRESEEETARERSKRGRRRASADTGRARRRPLRTQRAQGARRYAPVERLERRDRGRAAHHRHERQRTARERAAENVRTIDEVASATNDERASERASERAATGRPEHHRKRRGGPSPRARDEDEDNNNKDDACDAAGAVCRAAPLSQRSARSNRAGSQNEATPTRRSARSRRASSRAVLRFV